MMWQIALFLCLQTDPVDYVENLCENMQLFQKEDFLTGDQLLFEYKPEVNVLWTLIICFDIRKTCACCVIQTFVIKHNAGTGFVLIGTLVVFRKQICFVSLFFLVLPTFQLRSLCWLRQSAAFELNYCLELADHCWCPEPAQPSESQPGFAVCCQRGPVSPQGEVVWDSVQHGR